MGIRYWELLSLPVTSMYPCLLSHFSCVWLSATPWTVTGQAPLSMGFSRQEYWSGLSCPPPGDLSDPGIKPMAPEAPELQADSLRLSHWGSFMYRQSQINGVSNHTKHLGHYFKNGAATPVSGPMSGCNSLIIQFREASLNLNLRKCRNPELSRHNYLI